MPCPWKDITYDLSKLFLSNLEYVRYLNYVLHGFLSPV